MFFSFLASFNDFLSLFLFYFAVRFNSKIHKMTSSSVKTLDLTFWPELCDHLYLKTPKNSMSLIFENGSRLCILHLVVRSDFSLLHNSQWITFATQFVFNLVLLFCQFASITCYVINALITWDSFIYCQFLPW